MSKLQKITGGMLVVLMALVLSVSWAVAQTAQTVVIDGVNDFLPGNLVEDDGDDTEHSQLDLGEIYLTNDAVNLYVGIENDHEDWGTNQIGIAIDLGTPEGGSTDPWGRAIDWTLATNKPDLMFYVNLGNGWQEGRRWNEGTQSWDVFTSGTNSLGWTTSTGFNELSVMLGTIGVTPGDVINYEMWMTQDGATKGPLDLVVDDWSQLSLPEGTTWDTPAAIPLLTLAPYTILAAADPDPPVVAQVKPAAFPVDSFFDVFFNEPIDPGTGSVPGNFVLGGGPGQQITPNGAVVDGTDPSIVHLTFPAPLTASDALYTLTVTNVEDVAGNAIVADGVGNVGCFMIKEVIFRGKFGPFLNGQEEPHQFTVEGELQPLSWALCDGADMVDTGTDDIWEYSDLFCVSVDCDEADPTASFEWKFVYDCATYEPMGGNRSHTLDLANGATDIIEVWWNNEDPTTFTAHDIDVEFFVNMNDSAYMAGDLVGLRGNVLPLNHAADTPMVDDGTGNDAVADDGIFSALVTFPAGARKDVEYKFVLNEEYECSGLGDRTLFLNDELFDTVGGTLGPLTLPVVRYDFCNIIWRAVEVVFQVDFNNTGGQNIGSGDVVEVRGTPNHDGSFDWETPGLNILNDDGVYPDAVAGDKIYAVAVVFPDTSAQNVDYKYLVNEVHECPNQGNRHFSIDPDNFDDMGNAQILDVDIYQICGPVGVPEMISGLTLNQNRPNPFNPSTTISYTVPKSGAGSLTIYNVRGELVRTLRSGHFDQGPGMVIWDGTDNRGTNTGSGVYFYKLDVDGDVQTRRMLLLK